jgi:hypothetical protein
MMTAAEALAFVAEQGVVLQSARHERLRTLTSAIAGEPIRGSWWAHPKSREIFRVLAAVYASPDVVATRLVDDKITLIQRRLWGALATLAYARRIEPERLAQVTQEHTEAGRHEARRVPFPLWLPADLARPTADEALSQLGASLAASLLRSGDAAPRSRGSAGRGARGRRR